MFNRVKHKSFTFTEGVRLALDRARSEAVRRGDRVIHPEHILLGLVSGDDAVTAELAGVGLSARLVAETVEGGMNPASGKDASGPELPYSQAAKRVIEEAMLHARREEAEAVTTLHLFRAAVADRTRPAFSNLLSLGLEIGGPSPMSGALGTTFEIVIDDGSSNSIYEQIVSQITEAIATGKLKEGERLPPVRQLADRLEIAPGTVARAYARLEEQHVLITAGARGTHVAPRPKVARPPDDLGQTLVGLLRPVAIAAFHLGATAPAMRDSLEAAMEGILPDEPAVG